MLAEIIYSMALLTSLFYAATNVVIKRGSTAGTSMRSGFIISLVTSSVFFTILLPFILPSTMIPLSGIFWFSVSGLLGTIIGGLLLYAAIEKMGALLASPFLNTGPIFSSLFAVTFLGETLTSFVLVGTTLTVLGLFLLSTGDGSGAIRTWKKRYVAIPIASSAFYAMGFIAQKVAVGLFPNPIIGSAITIYAAFLGYMTFLIISRNAKAITKLRDSTTQKGAAYFVSAGILMNFARIAVFVAFMMGTVVVVGPLTGIGPLFTLPLAYFFLRKEERITLRLVVGVIMVALGVMLIVM